MQRTENCGSVNAAGWLLTIGYQRTKLAADMMPCGAAHTEGLYPLQSDDPRGAGGSFLYNSDECILRGDDL
jgi:hypothetical protein